MSESLDAVAKLAVLVFVVTSMVCAGLALSARDIAETLRRPRLTLLALVANFGVAPATAWALTQIIPLDPPNAIGLLLLGGAAGAPFLPKLVELARGDFAYSVGLMLLLTVGSVIFMPVILPLLLPGLAADPWPIARPLLLTMMLPLAAGLAVRHRSERWSARILPAFRLLSNLSLLAAVALLIGLNFSAMIASLGNGAALTAALFVALCFAAGYALGGPAASTRSVLGLGTGQRNIAAALVVATQNFRDPDVTVMLLVATFAGLFVLLVAAKRLARSGRNDRSTVER